MSDQHRTRVEQRAYELWEREGRPQGRHDHHWAEAERQVAAEHAPPAVRRDKTPPKPSPAAAIPSPRRKIGRGR